MDRPSMPCEVPRVTRLQFLKLPVLFILPCSLTVFICLKVFPRLPAIALSRSRTMPSLSSAPSEQRLLRCPHILLFSAPRHGSTWMIDSAERCRYSLPSKLSGKSTYSRLANFESELWHEPQNGPLRNISAQGAIEYLRTSGSMKVFPFVLEMNEERVRRIVKGVVKSQLPIIVLTRRTDHAHGSLMTAKENQVWNELSSFGAAGEKRGADEKDPRYQAYRNRLRKFFESVRKILNESGATMVDELDYDDVKVRKHIEARNSGCYIHNCNFKNNTSVEIEEEEVS